MKKKWCCELIGIKTIVERIAVLDGKLEVVSSKDHGTK